MNPLIPLSKNDNFNCLNRFINRLSYCFNLSFGLGLIASFLLLSMPSTLSAATSSVFPEGERYNKTMPMPSTLSAATPNDLRFTLIDGSYVVSAVDPSSITGAVNIPAIHKGLPVTKIGNFSNSKITSVTIPNSITTISDSAFYNCYSLTKFSIPQDSQLGRIGHQAFFMCIKLANIDLPYKSVYRIGSAAFLGATSLTSITIPRNITKIPESAFESCQRLSTVNLHEAVEEIGDNAFVYNYALKTITFPDALETIGINAFMFSGLEQVFIPPGVTSIRDNAFTACHDLPSVFFFGPAPGIGTDPFQQAGSNVGGFTIYVLPDYEDSFASWKKHYNIKVR